MKRREFFKLITAAAAMAVLPFKVIAQKVSPWRMILYRDGAVIAKCDGVVQSSLDTFEGEFIFKDKAAVDTVYLQHKTRKTKTRGVTFPAINVGQGDVLQFKYRLEEA